MGDYKGPPSHTTPHSPLREESFLGRMERLLVLKFITSCFALLLMLTACGVTPDQVAPQLTVTVSSGFQSQASPIPPIPTYLCGAWSSNNAPGPNSTIVIFARITKNLAGVVVQMPALLCIFRAATRSLISILRATMADTFRFRLPLQGRQPVGTPATVDVTFGIPGTTVNCTSAFFTPK